MRDSAEFFTSKMQPTYVKNEPRLGIKSGDLVMGIYKGKRIELYSSSKILSPFQEDFCLFAVTSIKNLVAGKTTELIPYSKLCFSCLLLIASAAKKTNPSLYVALFLIVERLLINYFDCGNMMFKTFLCEEFVPLLNIMTEIADKLTVYSHESFMKIISLSNNIESIVSPNFSKLQAINNSNMFYSHRTLNAIFGLDNKNIDNLFSVIENSLHCAR